MNQSSETTGLATLTSHSVPMSGPFYPPISVPHAETARRARVQETIPHLYQDESSNEDYGNPNWVPCRAGDDKAAPKLAPLQQQYFDLLSYLKSGNNSSHSSDYIGYDGTEYTPQIHFSMAQALMSGPLGGQEEFSINQCNFQQNTMLESQGTPTNSHWIQPATIRHQCGAISNTSFSHGNGMVTNNGTIHIPNSWENATTSPNTPQYQSYSLPSYVTEHLPGTTNLFSYTDTVKQLPPGCIPFSHEESLRLQKGEYVYADYRLHSLDPNPPQGFMLQTPEMNHMYSRSSTTTKRKRYSSSDLGLGVGPSRPAKKMSPPTPSFPLNNLPTKELSNTPDTDIKEEGCLGSNNSETLYTCCGINFQHLQDYNGHHLVAHANRSDMNEASPIGTIPFESTNDAENFSFGGMTLDDLEKMLGEFNAEPLGA